MLLQRFSWRQLLPLFAFLLCLLPAVFVFTSPKDGFKSALRQLDPTANGSHSWKIRSKTFILASLKRSAFNWITNIMDFCTAHFQPSHIFTTICKTNSLEQVFPMIDDRDSACFVRDVWRAKACLYKNITMIHGYKKYMPRKPDFQLPAMLCCLRNWPLHHCV